MKNIMLFLMALMISGHVMAQQATVKGTVTDGTDGSPLIGVSVSVKGTSFGTVTDVNGQYSISVPAGNDVLNFSYIGYGVQEVKLRSGQTILNVAMQEDSELLEEVVVVGYGTMKKSDLSGASVTVGEDKLKGSIITNIDQALQGRAAGVSSVATSGAPGSSVSIRVRGDATINANAEPLYVIDGIAFQSSSSSGHSLGLGDALGNGDRTTVSPMSTLNPGDIVSMEVLKDASATAIYGSRAANGVVLVTTKRGKAGEAKFSYDGMLGVQQQMIRIDMMNLREFAQFSNAVASETNGVDNRPEYSDPSLLGKGTNWQDAVFRRAYMHQHQVSAQGGTDKVKYYFSGSFMDQEGTIIGTDFSRYSVRANVDAQMKSWLKVGVNANYSSTSERLGLADSEEGLINYSLLTPPDIPIYDIDGNYASVIREGYTRPNPIALALNNDILLDRDKLTGSIFADIDLYKGLRLHSEFGYDLSHSYAEVFNPTLNLGNWSRGKNSLRKQNNTSEYWQVSNYLTYAKDIEKHNFSAMFGQETWESSWEYLSQSVTGLPSNDIKNPQLASDDPKITSGFGSSSMVSIFGRGTYNYDGRYMGTYTYRRDGSSNFGPKNRWANFHSFAASWRFSQEKFWEPISAVISNGKLRAGWGQTGNANIGGYLWGASINTMPTGLGQGYRQSNIANTAIKWETQEQINIGLDLSFLNNRINLTLDAYDKVSKDMLMQLQLPSYMGTRGNASSALAAPYGNYGEISNKGLEISLNTRNLTGAFEWDTDLQISFNKNELVALDGTDAVRIEGYGQWSDVVSISELGKPLYQFYGYVTDGIYQDLDDLKNSPKPEKYPADGVSFNRYNTVWVGDVKYKDISGPDGVPDGIIDENDRTIIGNPMPDFTFGFNNTFRYKNFDLTIFLNGSVGNDVMNYSGINLSNMKSTWNNQLRSIVDRAILTPIDPSKTYDGTNGVWNWFEDITNVKVSNPNATIPRAIANDPNDNDRISDRYIEDGSYLRIKNITLGYTLPTSITKKWKIDALRVYANFQNVYTFTNYSGYDPEIGLSTSSNYVMGVDNGRYPSPFSWTVGINFSF
ncbi:TonB-dependent receptor [Bacteroidales bacterium OttesenSCG-928-A17]|nr:TonB-dependent receptor [Bacteroidales bacterium OttesenSCG-928-A17]